MLVELAEMAERGRGLMVIRGGRPASALRRLWSSPRRSTRRRSRTRAAGTQEVRERRHMRLSAARPLLLRHLPRHGLMHEGADVAH